MEEFSTDPTGLLWLKTKSIIRKELIAEFLGQNDLKLNETASNKQFIELFELLCQDLENSHRLLKNYIKWKSKEQLEALILNVLLSCETSDLS